MTQKRKNTDYLDDLFDKHLNDKDFMSTNLADFGQMVRDTINEEARRSGYDTLEDMPAAMSMCAMCWSMSVIRRVSAVITVTGIRMRSAGICGGWRSIRTI